jgi:hypothetical protein
MLESVANTLNGAGAESRILNAWKTVPTFLKQ